MIHDQCKYSDAVVALGNLRADYSVENVGGEPTIEQLLQCAHVECPECGSIRQVRRTQNGTGPGSRIYYLFPIHNTLMGTARTREQWWEFDKDRQRWTLAKKEMVR